MKMERNNLVWKQGKKLGVILGLSSLDGAVALAAMSGFFKIENAFTIGVVFLAGPAAILTAALLDGNTKERIVSALLAGFIATIIVSFAAGVGPNLLVFLNIRVLRIFGAIAIAVIALMVGGIKINSMVPMIILIRIMPW